MSEELLQNSEQSAPKVIGRPFPKGVSGNPSGRPQGRRSFETLFRDAITKYAQSKGMTLDEMEEKVLAKGFQKAEEGDFKFFEDFHNRLYGKPVQRTENVNANIDVNALTDEDKEKIKSLIQTNSQ